MTDELQFLRVLQERLDGTAADNRGRIALFFGRRFGEALTPYTISCWLDGRETPTGAQLKRIVELREKMAVFESRPGRAVKRMKTDWWKWAGNRELPYSQRFEHHQRLASSLRLLRDDKNEVSRAIGLRNAVRDLRAVIVDERAFRKAWKRLKPEIGKHTAPHLLRQEMDGHDFHGARLEAVDACELAMFAIEMERSS